MGLLRSRLSGLRTGILGVNCWWAPQCAKRVDVWCVVCEASTGGMWDAGVEGMGGGGRGLVNGVVVLVVAFLVCSQSTRLFWSGGARVGMEGRYVSLCLHPIQDCGLRREWCLRAGCRTRTPSVDMRRSITALTGGLGVAMAL